MSPSESLTTCPWCGVHLCTEGLADDVTLICAGCRHMFEFRPFGDTRKISRKAIASLALGMIAPAFSCLTGLPGIALGVMALIEIRRREEQLKGRGIALAGIAASCLLGTWGSAILWAFLLPVLRRLS